MIDVVAALIRSGDRVLLCQRPEGKKRALKWEFPGGKVEKDETREQAIVRECREELDVTLCVNGTVTTAEHVYPDISIRLILMDCTIQQGEIRLLEHRAMRWVTLQEATGYDLCEADREFVQLLISEQ